ncbi:hypothetical protein Agub_g2165, partial [Astrephomene gubernaculifera]
HVQRLVQLSLVCPAYTAAAGAFFQSYAHRLLQQGGEFKVRRLGLDDKAQPTTLQLPPAPHTHVFTKLEEVSQQKDGVYCIPSNHNLGQLIFSVRAWKLTSDLNPCTVCFLMG